MQVRTRVWYETHSTTVDNENRVATGWKPGALSDLGRSQARQLGHRILERAPVAIYCSDLSRSVQTVTIALETAAVEVPVLLDWRLRECDYGELNGDSVARVHDDRLRYLTDPYPGGESWTAAIERTQSGVRDAARRHPGETIMTVGHIATHHGAQRAAEEPGSVADLITKPFEWQPGWAYDIAT